MREAVLAQRQLKKLGRHHDAWKSEIPGSCCKMVFCLVPDRRCLLAGRFGRGRGRWVRPLPPGSMSSFVDGIPLKEAFIVRANVVNYNGNINASKPIPIGGRTTLGADATSWAIRAVAALAPADRDRKGLELRHERDDPLRGDGRLRQRGSHGGERFKRGLPLQHDQRAGRYRADAADAELQRPPRLQREFPRRSLCADRRLQGRTPQQHGQELLDLSSR